MTENLVIEDLEFQIQRSDKRDTIRITVDRDGELIMCVPEDCSHQDMQTFANQKLFWVYSKLEEKQLLRRDQKQRDFSNGTSFYYLGRQHRLIIVPDEPQHPPLRLYRGQFQLRQDSQASSSRYFIQWYSNHAKTWLWNRTQLFVKRLNVKPDAVDVVDIGYEWGRCTVDQAIHYHWKTILLPPPLIDYVIVHELAHLRENNHTPRFWEIVQRVLPDYNSRKRLLALTGARYDF